ncbi:hypothetical protein SVIOM342S_09889 [Streptomyces violaceorubidus]
MSATSMTVTAMARTREPKGSPTRWATTSAWCTAARTDAARTIVSSATTAPGSERPQVKAEQYPRDQGRDGRPPCEGAPWDRLTMR